MLPFRGPIFNSRVEALAFAREQGDRILVGYSTLRVPDHGRIVYELVHAESGKPTCHWDVVEPE